MLSRLSTLALIIMAVLISACSPQAQAPSQTPAPARANPTLGAPQALSGPLAVYNPQARTLTLNNTVYTLAPNADLAPGLALGQNVVIEVAPQADGTLMVFRVQAASADDSATPRSGQTATPLASGEVEFTGVLSAINGAVWTVGERKVQITAQTEIKDSPQIGQRVKVHATQVNGAWLAREIERTDDDNNSGSVTPSPTDDNSGNGGDDNGGGDDDNGGGDDGDGGDDNGGGDDDDNDDDDDNN